MDQEFIDCKPNKIYNLETGECLHEDYPITTLQVTTVKNVRITGSGETLYRILLQNGLTKEHIENMKNFTFNIEDYVNDYKKRQLRGIPVFSRTLMVRGINLDLSGLPPESQYIPDFLTLSQSKVLYDKIIQMFSYGGNFIELTRPVVDNLIIRPYFPEWLICIIHLLIKGGYINRYPDNVYINNLKKGQGMNNHLDDPKYKDKVVILSLGSNCLMNFTKLPEEARRVGSADFTKLPEEARRVNSADFKNLQTGKTTEVPIINGSLLILSGKSRYDYSREIKNNLVDIYKLPGFPEHRWHREDRISIVLRFLD